MEKSLICITTCNRLDEVRKYLLPYVDFVRKNVEFDFLIALDGTGEDYIEFCETYSIPLLYSDDREGVGLSKNRVLSSFRKYAHYFFIEDDIELVNERIFDNIIQIAAQTGFSHFTITPLRKVDHKVEVLKKTVVFAMKGGAQFNYFTRNGLDKVGGWHTEFAKYKRFGHTEHSMRFVYQGLQPTPFISINQSIEDIIIHDPAHVTNIEAELNENEISVYEQEIINQKLDYFPITTLSDFRFNGMSLTNPGNELITAAISSADRYFLVTDRKQRRHAKVEFKVYQLINSKSIFQKLILIAEIVFLAPTNNAFKHWIKQKFRKSSH